MESLKQDPSQSLALNTLHNSKSIVAITEGLLHIEYIQFLKFYLTKVIFFPMESNSFHSETKCVNLKVYTFNS